jgi:hypothetical protein
MLEQVKGCQCCSNHITCGLASIGVLHDVVDAVSSHPPYTVVSNTDAKDVCGVWGCQTVCDAETDGVTGSVQFGSWTG